MTTKKKLSRRRGVIIYKYIFGDFDEGKKKLSRRFLSFPLLLTKNLLGRKANRFGYDKITGRSLNKSQSRELIGW